MEATMVGELLSLGLQGVIIAALAAVCVYLYKRVERLQSEVIATQEKRLTDLKELTTKMTAVIECNTSVLERNTDLLDDFTRQGEPKKGGRR